MELVERLRANAEFVHNVTGCSIKNHISTEAADEIERLRKLTMRDAWIKSRGNLYEPSYDFRDGFESCHDLLMPLLEMSAPHVFASAGAAHLTDGFKLRRHPIDELVERIKAVIPSE